MKQHEKWFNETLSDEKARKFESETAGVTTFDQAINAISKASWQGAMELVLEWLEIEEPFEVFTARIREELEE